MKVRSLDGLRVLRCPFCSLRIVADEKACSFRHEHPMCDKFGPALLALFPNLRMTAAEPTLFLPPPEAGEGS